MEQEKIQKLVELMNQNSLVELEVESEGERIRLKKAVEISPAATPPVKSAEHIPVATKEQPENLVSIKAPMVGTFYRSPAPDAAPLVDINQDIAVGQVVCVIEAMKVMNEIKSEIKGRVKQILVENTQPVEFGQTLFIVETS